MRSRWLQSAICFLLLMPASAGASAGGGTHAFRAPSGRSFGGGRGFHGFGGRHFFFFGGGGAGSFFTILIVLAVIAILIRNRRS